MTALEAAQVLVAEGLKREDVRLMGSGVSALAILANGQADFFALLQQCAAGEELLALAKLARAAIKQIPRRARVLDWTSTLHLVTRRRASSFEVELAELEIRAVGATLSEARNKLGLGVQRLLDRAWTSYGGHQLKDSDQVELVSLEALTKPSK